MATARNIFSANALAVAGATNVWTRTFNISNLSALGVWIQCAGSGPQIRIVLEESYISLTDAQQSLTNTNYVVPEALPDVMSLITDTNPHIPLAIAPVPMKHCRYKIIGLSGNSADTTVTIYTFEQELPRGYAS